MSRTIPQISPSSAAPPLPPPAVRAAVPPSPEPVPAQPTLIEAKNVSVFYGKHEAIVKVSLSMPKNSVVAMIGPSGCGKSTFLRAINRLNDLIPGCRVTGDLLIGGQNIYDAGIDLV